MDRERIYENQEDYESRSIHFPTVLTDSYFRFFKEEWKLADTILTMTVGGA